MRSMTIVGLAATLLAMGCGQSGAPSSNGDASPAGSTQTGASAPEAASATWALDTDASRISFASIKAGELIETHFFSGLSGKVTPDGKATIEIPLDQVETRIDIRNERMREFLFETGTFPVATINAETNLQSFAALPVGARMQTEIEGTLSLHGVEEPVVLDAFVTRIAEKRVEVSSADPVVVYLADFNLEDGVEKLRELAGLPSITKATPVTFTFVYEVDAD